MIPTEVKRAERIIPANLQSAGHPHKLVTTNSAANAEENSETSDIDQLILNFRIPLSYI